jgi:hypothetical protein
MGCYAALNVIKVAMDSAAARPEELVICNCTELSCRRSRQRPPAANHQPNSAERPPIGATSATDWLPSL